MYSFFSLAFFIVLTSKLVLSASLPPCEGSINVTYVFDNYGSVEVWKYHPNTPIPWRVVASKYGEFKDYFDEKRTVNATELTAGNYTVIFMANDYGAVGGLFAKIEYQNSYGGNVKTITTNNLNEFRLLYSSLSLTKTDIAQVPGWVNIPKHIGYADIEGIWCGPMRTGTKITKCAFGIDIQLY